MRALSSLGLAEMPTSRFYAHEGGKVVSVIEATSTGHARRNLSRISLLEACGSHMVFEHVELKERWHDRELTAVDY